jgi:hypothetical protein
MHGVKSLFEVAGGLAILLGLVVLALLAAFLFIQGGLWLSQALYPLLVSVSGLTLAVVIFLLLPNAIFSSTPRFAGGGMLIASYVFGASLWVWSFLITYMLWGWVGLAIGLFMAGVGVVPLAMIATLLNWEWAVFGQLVLLIMFTFGIRAWGAFLIQKASRRSLTPASVA